MQFTLPKLFFAIALAAIACAGMLSPTLASVSAVFTMTIALFACTALRAFKLRGREMVFALVFALSGALYLILATCQPFQSLGKALLTNYPIAWIARDQLMHGLITRTFRNVGTAVVTLPDGTTQEQARAVPAPEVQEEEITLDQIMLVGGLENSEDGEGSWRIKAFFLIGHCIWSWLIALLAAWFAGRMYAQRQATSTLPLPI